MQTTVSKYLLLGGMLLLGSSGYSVLAETLRVAVPDYPPFSYLQDEHIAGEGFDAFVAIMTQLDVDYRAEPVPHFGRSLIDMQNNLVDALLMATESPERNALAEYSIPLFVTDWAWVWLTNRTDIQPDSEQFKQTATVSAQMNSNIYRWLALQGYQIAPGTTDIRGLFNLLDHDRVDVIMLPALTATTLIDNHQLDKTQYKIHNHMQMPYGIYISKTYLAAHPGFMAALNQAIAEYKAAQP